MELATSFALAQFKEVGGEKLRLYILKLAEGDLEVLKTIIDFLNITPEEARAVFIGGASLAQMKWLAEKYQFSMDDARAVFLGEASLAQRKWLAEKYQFTMDDAVKVFKRACWKGCIATAQWLVDQFQLTRDALFPVDESPTVLINACHSGNIELVKWLIETYEIVLEDIKNCDILETACHNTQLVHYLINTFDFDRGYAILVFHRACDRGDLNLAKSLAEFYNFTAIEVREKNRSLIYCDNRLVREWLLDTYYKDITTN